MNSNVYVEAQMLIRKPVEDVFEAFINPEVTTNFWFTKSTGKLEEGKTLTWEWEMYAVKSDVKVLQVIQNQLIKTEWGETFNKCRLRIQTNGKRNVSYH
ncbi:MULTISPECIES: SRPBCC domain-containing protein [Chryseobacterium]|uniref:Uncharacterized protein YndB with AHSA1/START domain n=1 Tax=Chryseobacterium geocarposphaerae TaxID=1416776 RepID=A0ABU1LCG5_9FLAO|nr:MULTISPECIES: SRPBCC domain-containing protein [Chryseobacterium]MDR6404403.1 uncharacterized protein YndB with AHSA1/START domain [Chryseobacterium geocarposphaerae]MDR6699818.1 uncharacterized protein YndB with AHSA1/START domain [Chryseobacterium ginsenosidimutans]